jgi:hypothetical protein
MTFDTFHQTLRVRYWKIMNEAQWEWEKLESLIQWLKNTTGFHNDNLTRLGDTNGGESNTLKTKQSACLSRTQRQPSIVQPREKHSLHLGRNPAHAQISKAKTEAETDFLTREFMAVAKLWEQKWRPEHGAVKTLPVEPGQLSRTSWCVDRESAQKQNPCHGDEFLRQKTQSQKPNLAALKIEAQNRKREMTSDGRDFEQVTAGPAGRQRSQARWTPGHGSCIENETRHTGTRSEPRTRCRESLRGNQNPKARAAGRKNQIWWLWLKPEIRNLQNKNEAGGKMESQRQKHRQELDRTCSARKIKRQNRDLGSGTGAHTQQPRCRTLSRRI